MNLHQKKAVLTKLLMEWRESMPEATVLAVFEAVYHLNEAKPAGSIPMGLVSSVIHDLLRDQEGVVDLSQVAEAEDLIDNPNPVGEFAAPEEGEGEEPELTPEEQANAARVVIELHMRLRVPLGAAETIMNLIRSRATPEVPEELDEDFID